MPTMSGERERGSSEMKKKCEKKDNVLAENEMREKK